MNIRAHHKLAKAIKEQRLRHLLLVEEGNAVDDTSSTSSTDGMEDDGDIQLRQQRQKQQQQQQQRILQLRTRITEFEPQIIGFTATLEDGATERVMRVGPLTITATCFIRHGDGIDDDSSSNDENDNNNDSDDTNLSSPYRQQERQIS